MTIEQSNAPLHQSMLDKGYRWITNHQTNVAHFVDDKGHYVSFPVGYITGPHYNNNGNPSPICFSVNGPNGWLQRSFKTGELHKGEKWAVETAQSILRELEGIANRT